MNLLSWQQQQRREHQDPAAAVLRCKFKGSVPLTRLTRRPPRLQLIWQRPLLNELKVPCKHALIYRFKSARYANGAHVRAPAPLNQADGALNGVRTKKHVFHLLNLKDGGGIRAAPSSPLVGSGWWGGGVSVFAEYTKQGRLGER